MPKGAPCGNLKTMEKKAFSQEDQAAMTKSFRVAAWGIFVVLAIAGYEVYLAFKGDFSSDSTVASVVEVIGFFIWGGGMIAAGNILCKTGHNETGVTSAGGAMIFNGLVLVASLLFMSDNMTGATPYIWGVLMLIGPGIFYLSLKQDEKKKEDKGFGIASMGMGMVSISIIVYFAAIIIAQHQLKSTGNIEVIGDYYMVSHGTNIGMFVTKNIKTILIRH